MITFSSLNIVNILKTPFRRFLKYNVYMSCFVRFFIVILLLRQTKIMSFLHFYNKKSILTLLYKP